MDPTKATRNKSAVCAADRDWLFGSLTRFVQHPQEGRNMTKPFSIALALLCLAMSTMLACGDTSGGADTDSTTDPTGPITVQGAMQKGPLLTGSTLTVSMMRKGGVPTGVCKKGVSLALPISNFRPAASGTVRRLTPRPCC
jgi:hypothetical protein